MFETSTIVETQSKMSRCKVGNLLDIKNIYIIPLHLSFEF